MTPQTQMREALCAMAETLSPEDQRLTICSMSEKLPQEAKLAVVDYLLNAINIEDLGRLSEETLNSLRTTLATVEEGNLSPELLAERDAFCQKYNITVLGRQKISLEAPADVLAFVKEANALSVRLYDRVCIPEEDLFLYDVTRSNSFLKMSDFPTGVVTFNCYNVPHNNCRFEFDSRMLDLAHAAYFIATGTDLFGGKIVNEYFFTTTGRRLAQETHDNSAEVGELFGGAEATISS